VRNQVESDRTPRMWVVVVVEGGARVSSVALAVRLTTMALAPGDWDVSWYGVGPVAENDHAVMSALVSVPIVPSVVIVPLSVYPFCKSAQFWIW
jgi:hypothetical protein